MREPKMWHLDLPRRLLVLSCAMTYLLLEWWVFDEGNRWSSAYAGIAAMLVLAALPPMQYSRMVLCVVAVLVVAGVLPELAGSLASQAEHFVRP